MHILVHATLPQVHVAWLLWKNPQEARKVYWAFWRRNYYKVGEKNLSGAEFCPFFFFLGGATFSMKDNALQVNSTCFSSLMKHFFLGHGHFPLAYLGFVKDAEARSFWSTHFPVLTSGHLSQKEWWVIFTGRI